MNGFEASMILWIQDNLRGALDGFMQIVSGLGDVGILWILLGLSLVFWKKTRPIGITILLALVFDLLLVNILLKPLVARPRPFVVNEAIVPLVQNVNPYRSFPSGHSGASFAATLALSKWVPKQLGIPAVTVAAMIAFSRLYVGVHYPTDVLTGLAVGIISSLAAYYLVKWIQKKMMEKKQANG